MGKVTKIRHDAPAARGYLSQDIIKNQTLKDKNCHFPCKCITENEMVELLKTVNSDKPCVVDNMDVRLLKISARLVAKPLGYIFNLCLKGCVHPELRKTSKDVPLNNNFKEPVMRQNSRPISLLAVLSK